jgi:hypothetical protein
MIDAGKIPADWGGIELRWYMQDFISWDRHNDKELKKRKRNFRNTVLVNGL